MKKSAPRGMTKAEWEKRDFALHMAFVKAHRLADPEELEELLAKVGIDYLHKWKFKALIEQEGITCEEEWTQFLQDNPVIPTF